VQRARRQRFVLLDSVGMPHLAVVVVGKVDASQGGHLLLVGLLLALLIHTLLGCRSRCVPNSQRCRSRQQREEVTSHVLRNFSMLWAAHMALTTYPGLMVLGWFMPK
jgi:hypothetical protein